MIVLSGTLNIKPGLESKLIRLTDVLLPQSRCEAGCIRYELLVDAMNPARFVFFEIWRSQNDLNEHFEKEYFKIFANALPELVDTPPEIVTYETPGPVAVF
jgi:quinol monooxygenase YgiN